MSRNGRASKAELVRRAAVLFRALRRAELVELVRDPASGRRRVRVSPDLQRDFSLHHALSLYLVDAIWALDPHLAGIFKTLIESITI